MSNPNSCRRPALASHQQASEHHRQHHSGLACTSSAQQRASCRNIVCKLPGMALPAHALLPRNHAVGPAAATARYCRSLPSVLLLPATGTSSCCWALHGLQTLKKLLFLCRTMLRQQQTAALRLVRQHTVVLTQRQGMEPQEGSLRPSMPLCLHDEATSQSGHLPGWHAGLTSCPAVQHSPGYCCWLATARRGRGQAIANTNTKVKCQLHDLLSKIGPASTLQTHPGNAAQQRSQYLQLRHSVASFRRCPSVWCVCSGCRLGPCPGRAPRRVQGLQLVFWQVGCKPSMV